MAPGNSGGSRISHKGGPAPIREGGMDLWCGHFSVKMYAKMKELDPIEGACTRYVPLDPPIGNTSWFLVSKTYN